MGENRRNGIARKKISVPLKIYGVKEGEKGEVVRLFSQLFEKIEYGTETESLEETESVAVLVCLEKEEADQCRELLKKLLEQPSSYPVLLVYSKGENVADFPGAKRPFFQLEYPWSQRSLATQLKPFLHQILPTAHQQKGSMECEDLARRLESMEQFLNHEAIQMERVSNDLISLVGALSQTELDDRQKKYLGSINNLVSRLATYTIELRNRCSILEKKGVDLDVPFNINTVLEMLGEYAEYHASNRKLNFIFQIDRSVPATVKGNPVLLGQILYTLYDLMLKCDGLGDIVMKISLETGEDKTEEDAGRMVFEIINTVAGMDFRQEPCAEFFAKDEKLQEVKDRLIRMGSTLQIEANRLAFSFPVRLLDRRSYRLPTKEWMEKRVLIVTPNTHLAQALETMLGYFHFPIAVAQRASDLNRLFKDKGPFDMYFVDETVFAETLGQLLAHKRSGKLILVQEAGRQELISKKFRQYVDGILTKPFTQGALFNTILEVFAEDSLEGKRESLKILKENIVMLGEGKSLLYLGEENSDWILIQNLLEGTGVKLKRIDDPQKLLSEAAKADLLLLGHLPEEKQATVEKLLPRLGEGKPILQIQSKEVLQDLTGPEAYAKLGETLVSPIDPELFYRLLFDALL